MGLSGRAQATACIVLVNFLLTMAIISVFRSTPTIMSPIASQEALQEKLTFFSDVCNRPSNPQDHPPRPHLFRSSPSVVSASARKDQAALNDFCAPHKYVWQAEFGLHMCVYPHEKDQWVSGAFLSGGVWERENIEIMLRHLRGGKNGVIVDVGANIGTFSLIAAKEGHTVFAFEAHPTTADMLWRSIQLNNLTSRIHLWQNGLSDTSATAKIEVQNDFNQGGATVIEKRSAIEIELMPMDHVFDDIAAATKGTKIRFLKMDVEGHEPRVLRGAEKVLDLLRPSMMLMEISPLSSEKIGCSAAQVLRDLHTLGYKASRIGHGTVPQTSASGILHWLTQQGLYPSKANGDFVFTQI